MRLSEICEVYSGYAFTSFNDIKDGFPVVKIGNILADGTLNLEKCQYTTDIVNEKYYSKKGDIYIALSGATTGKIGIMSLNQKYVINQRVGIVRQKSVDIPQEYIKYFLLRQTDRILQEATGCAQPNISPKQIAEYIIPDISKEQMQEICEVLNRIKKIIDSRKGELVALDDLIKARFVEMFGTLDSPSCEFQKATLKELCNKITDGKHGGCQAEDGTGRYFVGAREIYDDKVHYDTAPEINIDEFEKDYKRCNIEIGDFLIVNTGATIGKSAIATDERTEHTLLQKSVALLKVKKEVLNPVFLKWCYRVNTQMYIVESASAQPNLLLSKINSTVIFVPNINLQNQFADFVKQIDKSKVAVQKALDETKMLFDSLMQEYFG